MVKGNETVLLVVNFNFYRKSRLIIAITNDSIIQRINYPYHSFLVLVYGVSLLHLPHTRLPRSHLLPRTLPHLPHPHHPLHTPLPLPHRALHTPHVPLCHALPHDHFHPHDDAHFHDHYHDDARDHDDHVHDDRDYDQNYHYDAHDDAHYDDDQSHYYYSHKLDNQHKSFHYCNWSHLYC